MPLTHETVIFDVHDCKVASLLSDTPGTIPTYSPWVDVPGIAEVGLDPNFVTAELKGDARVIAKKGRIDRFNFSGTYGKIALDALGVLLGLSVTDVSAAAGASITGSTTTGETTVSGTGFVAGLAGRGVSGTGIAPGTHVASVTSATELELSEDATATGSGVSLALAPAGEIVRARMASPAPLPYFKVGFKIEDLDTGLGDLHAILYKCQVTGGTLLGSSSDNFGQPTFDAEAIALEGSLPGGSFGLTDTGVMVDFMLMDTATPL